MGVRQTEITQQDSILPFQLGTANARGRAIRASTAVDTILSQHAYPEPVSALLGEAIVLTALLGSTIKTRGKFILQTNSDGPVSMLVVQYNASGDVRGYVSFDADKIEALQTGNTRRAAGELLGTGHLAMTIDPGTGMERYQGVVALEGGSLADAADLYFRQSEQLPTFIRLAVARAFTGGGNGIKGNWSWRAGGILVQKLTDEGGVDSPPDDFADDDEIEDWTRAHMLAATVQDHELLDVESGELLYRLFHEEEVRVFDTMPVQARCSCSRERIEEVLSGFDADDIAGMAENGEITVKCEFCNQYYSFEPDQFGGA
jgi:molecular chaperone Hsp33